MHVPPGWHTAKLIDRGALIRADGKRYTYFGDDILVLLLAETPLGSFHTYCGTGFVTPVLQGSGDRRLAIERWKLIYAHKGGANIIEVISSGQPVGYLEQYIDIFGNIVF